MTELQKKVLSLWATCPSIRGLATMLRRPKSSVHNAVLRLRHLGLLQGAAAEPAPPPAMLGRRRFDPLDPVYRAPTIDRLRKGELTLSELAEFLGVSETRALDMVRSLEASGHNILRSEGGYTISGILRPETAPIMLPPRKKKHRERSFGVVSDTHLCSTHQRLDVLEQASDEFQRQQVEAVFCPGNLLDGYREGINAGEVLFRNQADQCCYLADHYPQRKGITTWFLTGDCHEGWWAKSTGQVIGHAIEDACRRAGREDMRYAGHLERDFELAGEHGRAVLRMMHPSGGSAAYAISYRPQKIVESYQGGEKPAALLLGHYHKMGDFYVRGVWTLLAGCCQDQTRFMRGKALAAHVGFVVVRVTQDANGALRSWTAQKFPFYDRTYHLELGEFQDAVYEALR